MTDYWNLIDVIPPLFIIVIMIMEKMADYADDDDRISTRHGLQAFTSFFMWMKVFYFLRIFRETGFFVNMLGEVVKKSSVFFLLYMLIILAFTSSFYILEPPGEDQQNIFEVIFYSYLLSLGEFGDMEWGIFYVPGLYQLFFILSTLLVLIVMLNILIALVSQAYE